jgi:hypothetical protein
MIAAVLRRLFNLAAAVSLALCVATAVMWRRSCRVNDEVQREVVQVTGQPGQIFASPGVYSSVLSRLGSHVGGMYVATTKYESSAWDAEVGLRANTCYVNNGEERDGIHYTLEGQFEAAGVIQLIRPNWRRLGFDWGAVDGPDGLARYAVVPYWIIVALLLALPAKLLIQRLRRRKLQAADRCTSCGYDLRATPQRCPGMRTSPGSVEPDAGAAVTTAVQRGKAMEPRFRSL